MSTETTPEAGRPSVPAAPGKVTARSILAAGFSAMRGRAVVKLMALNLLVAAVANSLVGDDALVLGAWLLLTAVGVYVQIAATLAAVAPDPGPSADRWMKEAFARRCFWRFIGTTLLQLLLVFVGFIGLVVGAFVVGGIVGVAPAAAVLEKRSPGASIQRSAELTKPARRAVATVFGLLVILPALGTQLAVLANVTPQQDPMAWWWITIAGWFVTFLATLSVARAFMALGGSQVAARPPGP